jgi:uncharacterized OB-fold protein
MAQRARTDGFSMLVPGLVAMATQPGDQPALIGSRCENCDAVVFPRIGVCPACRKPDTMRPVEIGRTGKLYSFTIARAASVGFTAPYFQAYVDLPEGPRIFALISGSVPVEPQALREGMALELVIEPVRKDASGQPVLTYKYRPLNGAGASS